MSEGRVFINAPFDDNYFEKLKGILFCLLRLNLTPLIAETSDSSAARVHRILDLMKQATFSIHDLSNVQLSELLGLPRFNMPFEFGVDFGLKHSGLKRFQNKKMLVLDSEPRRYQASISDLAGSDVFLHRNEVVHAIKAVRDFFAIQGFLAPTHFTIMSEFTGMNFDLTEKLAKHQLNFNSIGSLPFADMITQMKSWIEAEGLD